MKRKYQEIRILNTMSYTPEMIEAERNLTAAMRAWNIVQQENPEAATGVLMDTDTEQNGVIVPTRMEYVREGLELRVTRITQGSDVIYDGNARPDCDRLAQDMEAFFQAQPQMEAVFSVVSPAMTIPYNCSFRGR